MNKNKMAPPIRFQGFTGDWEQRKIGDCFTERKESMPKGELLSVTINEGIKRFSELERHDSSNQDKSKYRKVCIGDIAYNSMRMWQGASGFSDYEGIVSPAYTVLKPHDGIDVRFVSYLFKTKDLIHVFQINSQGITSDNWNLKFPVLSTINIKIPEKIEEQNKIAEFLAKLDNLITLHQHKLEQQKKLKAFFLKNMFPEEGETVPRIRFKEFTGDWEQRKIADVAEIITGGTPSTRIVEYWNPPEVPWLSSGEVHKKYITSTYTMISRKGYENSSATMVRENSVLIALAGQGKTRGTVAINRIPLATNQSIAAMTFSDDIDPDYVFSNLENRYEELRRISSGDGSRGGLNKKLVGDVTIPCPTLLEQNAIGTLFRVLNELITLHQRKIDQLQAMKKFMLQNLFV